MISGSLLPAYFHSRPRKRITDLERGSPLPRVMDWTSGLLGTGPEGRNVAPGERAKPSVRAASHASGVTVSRRLSPQGTSCCRRAVSRAPTDSGHYGGLYNRFIIYHKV